MESLGGAYDMKGDKKTITMHITNELATVCDSLSGRSSRFYKSILNYQNYVSTLDIHTQLPSHPTKLICTKTIDGQIRTIKIPEQDAKRLLEYLVMGSPGSFFDCQSFMHMIKGSAMRYPHSENSKVFFDKWIRKASKEPHLGDYVLLTITGSDGQPQSAPHHAYALGNGLYISKYGTKKGLYISTMDQMHSRYATNDYIVLIPNPLHEDNKNI